MQAAPVTKQSSSNVLCWAETVPYIISPRRVYVRLSAGRQRPSIEIPAHS